MFKKVIIDWKHRFSSSKLDDETCLQAFVACGGLPNGDGHVEVNKLVEIVKNQFEMTININRLIDDLDTDGSGVIEYYEFKSLL